MRSIKCIIFVFSILCFVYTDTIAQGFRFNCQRDTTIPGCTSSSCITLKAKVPDIHASTSDYKVNLANSGSNCYVPYVLDSVPGTSAFVNIIDDTYSSAISLPFSFPFYDDANSPYNSLVISTNGYISFDVSQATKFSHWTIPAGATGNLPSTSFDRSLAMGVYHDLDPSPRIGTSPNQFIKTDVIGTAPYRRFIVTFYKIPLFSGTCNALIENTHQIVLYETLGIIEVYVRSLQRCPSWNSGRKLIGLQNYNRNKGIMPPGRSATDAAWGNVNMNEVWRFVPASGASLLRSVELFDINGNLVSTGDTVNLNDGNMEVTFQNVCQTTSQTYIVKSKYEIQGSNPVEYRYGTDTILVHVTAGLPTYIDSLKVTDVICRGGSDGTIQVNAGGSFSSNYKYSLNSSPLQSVGMFTGLTPGTYQLHIEDMAGAHCPKDTTITVNEPANQISVDAGLPKTIMVGDQIQLNGSANGATSILWTSTPVSASLSSNTILNPIASPIVTTTYKLTVTNVTGCSESDEVVITVLPRCIKVRDAFSPNGDGINDKWKIYEDRGCLSKVSVKVYNRNGSLVYESPDYFNDWDGTYKGKPVPDATYYAVINFNLVYGKKITTKTDLTILR